METKTLFFEDLRKLAYSAYSGSSFSPEKRAETVVSDYSGEIESDLVEIPEDQKQRYTENYRKHLTHYLSSKSRTYSPMISGPSNFPARRMEKLNRWTDSAYSKFRDWRDRALQAIAKQKQADKSTEQKIEEHWQEVKKNLTRHAVVVIGIDNGTEKGCSRPLFVRCVTGSVQALAKSGQTEMVRRALSYIRDLNKVGPKPIVTEKHGIWGLEEVAADAEHAKISALNRENEIQDIGEIQIVKNYGIDRLQILFPGKPCDEMRSKLKANAFKWSPREMAWQRQLTGNAEYAAKRVLGIE